MSWLRRLTLGQWEAIDAETVDRNAALASTARAEDTREPRFGRHARVISILVVCALSLTIQEYVGGADHFERWFPYDGGEYWELLGFVWWSGWRVIGYVVIPVLAILVMPGERLRDYHVGARGFFGHLWIYGALFAAFLPVLIAVSFLPSFRETYPFYRLANRSYFDLVAWEALYVVQFISLEFFFRGFLLAGLRPAMGANAIAVMAVPYCMIHFTKPLPETIGAIGAGLLLGTLAMRTRSIWGGVLIHVAVAITMDVLALSGCPPFGSGAGCHP